MSMFFKGTFETGLSKSQLAESGLSNAIQKNAKFELVKFDRRSITFFSSKPSNDAAPQNIHTSQSKIY